MEVIVVFSVRKLRGGSDGVNDEDREASRHHAYSVQCLDASLSPFADQQSGLLVVGRNCRSTAILCPSQACLFTKPRGDTEEKVEHYVTVL